MRRHALTGVLACTLALAACGGETADAPIATSAPSTTTTSEPSRPTTPASEPATAEYWLRVDREGYLTMNVNDTYTDQQLRDAFLEVQQRYEKTEEGGWHVWINCGDSQTAEGGAQQAYGKFALDNLGAARTGLEVGGYEFEPRSNRPPCPPAPVESSNVDMSQCSDSGSIKSPEMAEAFAALPPRENVELLQTMAPEHSDERSMVAAIYYVCAPELVGDDLKDFATELATALGKTSLADTVYSMSVHNFYGTDTLDKLRAQPFQQYNFDDSINPAALRPAWERLPG